MQFLRFRYLVPALALAVTCGAPLAASAQNNGVNGPPKVLVINREYTKPGRNGAMHEKTEGAYLAAARANHAPFHYLAMTSLTGPDRAIFLDGYASYTDWAAEEKAVDKAPGLSAALDHAMVADGDLLSETDESVWVRSDDMSMNPTGLKGDRVMEIEVFAVKPGHDAQWEEAVKLVKAGYEKGVPEASWTMFHEAFGGGNNYAVFIPLKSVGDLDVHMMNDPKFEEAMGPDGMKKLDMLMAASVSDEQHNLFAFSPKMSDPPEEWIQADPDYWKPHTEPMRKSEKKP